eukprot:5228155-Amphidinium_carterae.1
MMCWLQGNQLSGKIPEGGFKAMTALSDWSTAGNSMTGTLPEEGMKAAELGGITVAENLHTGSVPCALLERGYLASFLTARNHFTGTLCTEGVRGMTKI